jgi:hypothetical protein
LHHNPTEVDPDFPTSFLVHRRITGPIPGDQRDVHGITVKGGTSRITTRPRPCVRRAHGQYDIAVADPLEGGSTAVCRTRAMRTGSALPGRELIGCR